MYIDSLYYQNVGPIDQLNIKIRKNEKGVPVPLIIVGKNGSGKSILLSNIVDAFYEIADKEYDNATEDEKNGHQYYKEIDPAQIKIGRKYMVAHINFWQEDTKIEYLFKSGKLSFEEYQKIRNTEINKKFDWGVENNFKENTVEIKKVKDIFENNIICYFGPNRYMKPSWLGSKYFVSDDVNTYSLRPRYSKQLNNPITAVNISNLTLQWLFDVITDSRADLQKKDNVGGYNIIYPNINSIDLLAIARSNIEKIMSEILGQPITFRMGNRSLGKRRFSICEEGSNNILVPSLDALSTGQLSVFNMFATIIRYADTDDIDLSYKLEDVQGIVIIDEIELHLHAQLQREILPKLIALFPKVQFIITSHSTLFLLGMKEQFGDGGFDIIEMPSGSKISAEQFSEFEKAYQYFSCTEKYKKEIEDAISKKQDRPLIITEGATDWKHMKAAYSCLKEDPRYSEWLSSMDFDFLEYEPKNSTAKGGCKLEMSGSQLKTMCEQYCLVQQPRKMIFIADADLKEVRNALSENGSPYKVWGNNVYSLILPLPQHRSNTPEICIEHYYSDEQLKMELEMNGIKRRLYMGCEFDTDGLSLDKKLFCNERNSCGEEKIRIIDGHDKSPRVYQIDDLQKTNIALSKMTFANSVLNKIPPYDQMDFSNFIPLFRIVDSILKNDF